MVTKDAYAAAEGKLCLFRVDGRTNPHALFNTKTGHISGLKLFTDKDKKC